MDRRRGAEYAFAPNLSSKIEYLFVHLADPSCPITTCGIPGTKVKFGENIVRAGLNWRFDWSGSPAATND